jgi:pyridoxamine 5'-phosphate oxidase-like protein
VPKTLKGTLPWDWAVERLEQAAVYWVATTRPDGRSHVMPTWGAWVDGAFWMEGGEQTRRMRNLALNPNAVVHVERGDDVVIVEGIGEKIVDLDPDLIQRVAAGFHKYVASHGYAAGPENWTSGIWVIRPRVAFAWSAFPTDATRWTFG